MIMMRMHCWCIDRNIACSTIPCCHMYKTLQTTGHDDDDLDALAHDGLAVHSDHVDHGGYVDHGGHVDHGG